MSRTAQSVSFGAVLAVVLLMACTLAADAARLQVHYNPGSKQQVLAAAAKKGYKLVKDYGPRFEMLTFTSDNPSAVQDLSGIPGVKGAAESLRFSAPKPVRPKPKSFQDAAAAAKPSKGPFKLPADAFGAAGVPKRRSRSMLQDELVCPPITLADIFQYAPSVQIPGLPDVLPYGFFIVQAGAPAVRAAARTVANNILYCVIDNGVLATHPDLAGNNINGAAVCYNETDAAGNPTAVQRCPAWDDPKLGHHGTHVIGTIAAELNGQGVVGITAAKSNVFSFNAFGDREECDDGDVTEGISACVDELEKMQKINPAAKMIVSMSLGGYKPAANASAQGGQNSRPTNQSATHYNFAFATTEGPWKKMYNRGDILFVAAAGNDGNASLSWPAGYQSVISVGAVDWEYTAAPFTNVNNDIELTAPGVSVLSTFNVEAMVGKPDQEYYLAPRTATLSTTPAVTGVDLSDPAPKTENRISTSLSAELVDCGRALNDTTTCDAKGKICLIQRGGGAYDCANMNFCQKSGGIGAIIYHVPYAPCQVVAAQDCTWYSYLPDPFQAMANDLPAVGIAHHQGEAIRQQLAAGTSVTVNLSWSSPTEAVNTIEPYGLFDGTSMAAPHVTAVAGIVWSAYPQCSNDEIRKALQMSALDTGKKGRDDYYGYGVVQANGAMEYLAANPCKGKPAQGAGNQKQPK